MYVKDEGANLNTFTNALTNIVSCVPWLWAKLYVVSFTQVFFFFFAMKKIKFHSLYLKNQNLPKSYINDLLRSPKILIKVNFF
jgi:type II secretory pathway component PulF